MFHQPKIAVASPSFCRSSVLRAELEQLGLAVTWNESGKEFDEASLSGFLAASGAEIAVIGREPVTAQVLSRCPQLRLIAKYGVGIERIDLAALQQGGVQLGWTPGVNKRDVAELVLGFLLLHFRNLDTCLSRMRNGVWFKNGGRSLSGLVVGIIGFGNVGGELARLLQPFGTQVLCCDIEDRSREAEALGAKQVSYTELLSRVDAASFHVPETPETVGLFGPREISLVKPSALIINTARAAVVDFSAVCAAVESGKLGGFAADVFSREPVEIPTNLRGERFYFTAHIGGNSQQAVLAMGKAAIAAIKIYLQTTPL